MVLLPKAHAGNGDQFFTLNAGFLFQNTLNASFGYEKELNYDNAFEIFGEAGNRWEKDPECGKVCSKSFWKNYYWNGGIVYKKSIAKWRNSTLRIDLGPVAACLPRRLFLRCGRQLRVRLHVPFRLEAVDKAEEQRVLHARRHFP